MRSFNNPSTYNLPDLIAPIISWKNFSLRLFCEQHCLDYALHYAPFMVTSILCDEVAIVKHWWNEARNDFTCRDWCYRCTLRRRHTHHQQLHTGCCCWWILLVTARCINIRDCTTLAALIWRTSCSAKLRRHVLPSPWIICNLYKIIADGNLISNLYKIYANVCIYAQIIISWSCERAAAVFDD